MRPEILEIIKKDPSGSAERKITCLASRITVFTANKSELFDEYELSLQVTGYKNFFVSLDGSICDPESLNLLGFEEECLEGTSSLGEIINSLNLTVEQKEHFTKLPSITPHLNQQLQGLHRSLHDALKILCATREPNKPLILKSPFSGLTDEVVEFLASAIIDFVSKSRGLVVVTRIDKKPKCWIDSPYISKMSLQRVRKDTIGMTPSLHRKDVEELEELKNVIQAEKKKSNLKTYLLAANIIVISLYITVVSTKRQAPQYTPSLAVVGSKVPQTIKKPDGFLDSFPYYIKSSIIEAAKNPEVVLKKIALGTQKEVATKPNQQRIARSDYPDETTPQDISLEEKGLKFQQLKEKLEQKKEITRLQKIRSDFINNIQDTYNVEKQDHKINAFFNQLEMELGGVDLDNTAVEFSEADIKRKFKHLKVGIIKEKFQKTLAEESDPEERKLIANRLVNALSVATDF